VSMSGERKGTEELYGDPAGLREQASLPQMLRELQGSAHRADCV